MFRLKGIIFDLDGTLIDSKIDYSKLSSSVKDFLLSQGLPSDDLNERKKIYQFILNGEKVLRKYYTDKSSRKMVLEKMNLVMNKVEMEAVHLVKEMPNAKSTLKLLSSRGMSVGIATRGSHEYALKSLELTGLSPFIAVLVARDRVEHPKPDPRHMYQVLNKMSMSPDEVVYIGDSPNDFIMAKASGVKFYGYRRNPIRVKRLFEAGCHCTIDDLCEVIDIIDKFS